MSTTVDFVGAELFGRGARLRFLLWVDDRNAPFWQQQASRETGIPPQYLASELERLVRLGMLQQAADSDVWDRRCFYERRENPLWQVVEAARQATSAIDAATPEASPHV